MRILHVIASADPRGGGPIEGVRSLSSAFAARGVSVELLTLDTPDMPWVSSFPVPVHAKGRALPSGRGMLARLFRWAAWSPEARDWLVEHHAEYNAVFVEGLWNYSTRIARVALVGTQTPYFVFTHGMLDPWFKATYPAKHLAKSLLWRVNEGPLLRGASNVLFTCERERELAHQSFPMDGAHKRVVGFGTAPPPPSAAGRAALSAAIPALKDRRFFLFLSRIHRKKGCDLLIDGFAAVAAAHPDIDLVIAGPGSEELVGALKAQAATLGVAQRIHWPGMIEGEAKWQAFRAAEAFVLTSHQENFGVVVAEAAACGRPVLISDQVNIHPEVTAAGAGLVEPDNADGARRLFERFLALSPEARDALGAQGKALFERQFEMGSVAERLIELVNTASRTENPK